MMPNQSPEPPLALAACPKAFGVPAGHRGSRRESAVAQLFSLDHMSTTDTKRPFSTFIFWLCALQAALGLFASAFWFEGITKDTEGWPFQFRFAVHAG